MCVNKTVAKGHAVVLEQDLLPLLYLPILNLAFGFWGRIALSKQLSLGFGRNCHAFTNNSLAALVSFVVAPCISMSVSTTDISPS